MRKLHVIPNEAKRNEESPEDSIEISRQTSGDSSHRSSLRSESPFGMTCELLFLR